MVEVVRLGVEIDMSDQSEAGIQRTIAQLERAKGLIAEMRQEAAKTGAEMRATLTPVFGPTPQQRARIEQSERDARSRIRRLNRESAQQSARDSAASQEKSARDTAASHARSARASAESQQKITDRHQDALTRQANATVASARMTNARVANVVQQGQQQQVQSYQLHGVRLGTAAAVGGQKVVQAVQGTNAAVSRAQGAGFLAQTRQARLGITQMAHQVAQAALPGRMARAVASSRRATGGPDVGGALMSGLRTAFSFPAIAAGYATGQAVDTLFTGPIKTADDLTRLRIGTEQIFRGRNYPGDPKEFSERLITTAIRMPGAASELMDSARTLMAYGFSPEQVLPRTPSAENPGLLQMVGDVGAVLGQDRASRIALALGQIKSSGRLSGQDLMQLTTAGIPAQEFIARGLTRDFGAKEGGRVFTQGDVRKLAENNQIGPQRALGYIQEFTNEVYKGSAVRVAGESAGGVMEQITDFVRLRIADKWGEGLRAGILPALKELNASFDDTSDGAQRFQEGLKRAGETVGTGIARTGRSLIAGFETADWAKIAAGGDAAGEELGRAMGTSAVRMLADSFSPTSEGGKSLSSQAYALGIHWADGFAASVMAEIGKPSTWARLPSSWSQAWGDFHFNPESSAMGRMAIETVRGIARQEGGAIVEGDRPPSEFEPTVGPGQYQAPALPAVPAGDLLGRAGEALRRARDWIGGILPHASTAEAAGPSDDDRGRGGGGGGPGGGALGGGIGGPMVPAGGADRLLTMAQSSGNQALAADLARRGYPPSVISQICGPLAVSGLASAYGVQVSPADVAAAAQARGEFSPGSGVTNATAFLPDSLRALGLSPIALEREQALQAMQNGRPVAINTPAHYYLGQGYDPATGMIDTGNTGGAMSRFGGSRYMSLSQIEAISGGLYGYTGVGPGQQASGGGASGRFTGGLTLGTNAPEWRALAREAAASYGLDPEIFERQMQREAGFVNKQTSGAGAQGLAQLMPGTARGLGVTDPMDPRQSLYGGAKYLRENLDRFGGDYEQALRGYNAGPGRVAESRSFRETNDYVRDILGTGGNNAPFGGTIGAQGGVAGAGGSSGVSIAPGAVVINVLDVRAIDPAVLNQVGSALVDVIAQKLGGKVNEMSNNFGLASAGP